MVKFLRLIFSSDSYNTLVKKSLKTAMSGLAVVAYICNSSYLEGQGPELNPSIAKLADNPDSTKILIQ
jgi:hypothetical protein